MTDSDDQISNLVDLGLATHFLEPPSKHYVFSIDPLQLSAMEGVEFAAILGDGRVIIACPDGVPAPIAASAMQIDIASLPPPKQWTDVLSEMEDNMTESPRQSEAAIARMEDTASRLQDSVAAMEGAVQALIERPSARDTTSADILPALGQMTEDIEHLLVLPGLAQGLGRQAQAGLAALHEIQQTGAAGHADIPDWAQDLRYALAEMIAGQMRQAQAA